MRTLSLLLVAVLATHTAAQERPLPAARTPTLRLDPGRAHAPVTALGFSPDGGTLYVAGLDKVVRGYPAGRDGPPQSFRVPVGPGAAGAINALAVAPDGKRVAVAGPAPVGEEAGFGQDGVVVPFDALPDAARRDRGVIYLFDPANPNGGAVHRGMAGAVRAVAFSGPVVVAAGVERAANGGKEGVVRVWDAATGKELARRGGFPATDTRPGLAAWPTGPGRTDLRVAVAWPPEDTRASGKLVLWDVAANTVQTRDDGRRNSPLAVRYADGKAVELLSGGFVGSAQAGVPFAGRLSIRPASGDGGRVIDFPSTNGRHYLPLAAAWAGESVAVLLEVAGKPSEGRPTELRLVGPNGEPRATVDLTGVLADHLPVLAADARSVAVSGFADHRVEVYAVADLLAGKTAPRVIPGAAGGFTGVAFLAGGGLWLGRQGETPARGGRVFDPGKRVVQANDGKAAVDAPKADGAEFAAVTDRQPNAVTVRAGGAAVTCELDGKQRPTAWAYLPAGAWPNLPGPALAVAHEDDGWSLVSLFDARTGRLRRRLVGPEQPVRGLAFAASRPLLAAVGDERAVTVWSLADLATEPGGIDGFVVSDAAGGVTVAAVPPPLAGKLTVGDVVTGIGQEQMKQAADFRAALRTRPVGSEVALQVKGKPAVTATVTRVIEQRPPLFHLWADAAGADWVAWSPAGPYDASSPAAEARIGWQTATGDPARPVSFAGAAQYRQQFYKPDLFRFVVQKADLSPAVDAWLDAYPPPPPTVRARVLAAEAGPNGEPVVRGPAPLRIDLSGLTDRFPLDRAVMRWRAAGPDGKFSEWAEVPLAGRDKTFSVPPAGHRWDRGRHQFEVTLHRTPASPSAADAAAAVVYLPPRPELAALVNGRAAGDGVIELAEPTIAVSAAVTPAAGQAADLTVAWVAPGGEPGSLDRPAGPVSLKLQPGVTTVRVTATTRGAGDYAPEESRTAELRLRYTPPKVVPPPTVGRLTVIPVGEERTLDARPVRVVEQPTVRVEVKVQGEQPITAVEWDDGAGQWVAEPNLPAGRATHALTRTVKLPEGKARTLRVRAKGAEGGFAVGSTEVVYLPPPPDPGLDRPPEKVSRPGLEVKGIFPPLPAGATARMDVTVTAGGKTRAFPADITDGKWRAEVRLEPGINVFGLVFPGGQKWADRPNLAVVAYRRPPQVVGVRPVDAAGEGEADVVAEVRTARGLDPTGVLVNGRPAAIDPPKRVAVAGDTEVWEVTAPAVPLRTDGQWLTELKVVVRNAEGDSEPTTVKVSRTPAQIRPPIITFADGGPEARRTDRPQASVRFRVESEVKLSRVGVWRAARADGEFEPLPAGAVNPDRVAGGFVLTKTVEVDRLAPGLNRVRLTAQNAGGEAAATVLVTYNPPPVQVAIESVIEVGKDGAGGRTLARRPGQPADDPFAPAATGIVEVRGRLRWSADAPAAGHPDLTVVLSANGVEHLPVQVGPPGGDRERTFRAPVFLNAAATRVRIGFRVPGGPAVPRDAAGDSEFTLHTTAPLADQYLHLVVVGVGVPERDRAALGERVVRAVGGTVPADRAGRFEAGDFTAGAFAGCTLYRPLVGAVNDGDVAWALDHVRRQVRQLAEGRPGGWVNDVVFVYFQGRDQVGADGHWSVRTAAGDTAVIRLDGLPAVPGVEVVVVNAVAPGRPQAPRSGLGDGPALLRYGWADAAAAARLLTLLQGAVGEKQTLGEVVDLVRARLAADPDRAADPVERLPDELRTRRIGARR